MNSRKIKYTDRLKEHPGVPILMILLPMLFVAALGGETSAGDTVSIGRAAIGALAVWALPAAIVLWTARTQPVPGE